MSARIALGLLLVTGCYSGPQLPDFKEVARPAERDAGPVVEAGAPEAVAPVADPLPEGVLEDPAAPEPTVLARVGALDLTAEELLQGLSHRQRDVLLGEVNRAVGQRLARQEAARLGLRLDPRAVDRRAAEYIGDFARDVVPDGMDLEEFVSRVMQRDPAAFRSAIQNDTLGEMVVERVVRAFTLAQEHARVRLLVADERGIAEALRRLEAGEEFEALVGELSRDPSAEAGGVVPFVINSPQSPLARLVFTTAVGEIAGPLEADGGANVLLRVESRSEPQAGDWTEVGAAVEASLAENEIAEEEFLFWQVKMEDRYQVDLEPLQVLLDG